jgi:uncharacterized protein (DUF305 family)
MKRLIIILSITAFVISSCKENSKGGSESENSNTAENMADSSEMQSDNSNSMMSLMMKQMETMNNMKTMNDPDHDFAMMMKYHHTAAKEMAELELLQGHHSEVKSLARKIITDQDKEIQEFDKFLNSTPVENKPGNDKFFNESMQMMKDMPMDMNKSGIDTDQQFITMMIPHHEQAIGMSRIYLRYAKKDNLKTMANNIITTQQNEIKELKDLQAKSH